LFVHFPLAHGGGMRGLSNRNTRDGNDIRSGARRWHGGCIL
jgi:hypothetical protein